MLLQLSERDQRALRIAIAGYLIVQARRFRWPVGDDFRLAAMLVRLGGEVPNRDWWGKGRFRGNEAAHASSLEEGLTEEPAGRSSAG
jgi:hypothetical protein